MATEIIFLGMNPAGEKTLEWLGQREDVEILEVLTEKEELTCIENQRPDLVISSGFEYKVPEEVLEIPENGIVNLHPSFLPYNRGAHPYIWPMIEETPAGVSIHYMDEKIDAGPVINRREVEMLPEDTAKDIHDRLQEEQFQLFTENWERIKEGVKGEEQDLEKGSKHSKSDLDEISSLNLGSKFEAGELIDVLRALTYGEKGLTTFERNGETYSVKINIEKV